MSMNHFIITRNLYRSITTFQDLIWMQEKDQKRIEPVWNATSRKSYSFGISETAWGPSRRLDDFYQKVWWRFTPWWFNAISICCTMYQKSSSTAIAWGLFAILISTVVRRMDTVQWYPRSKMMPQLLAQSLKGPQLAVWASPASHFMISSLSWWKAIIAKLLHTIATFSLPFLKCQLDPLSFKIQITSSNVRFCSTFSKPWPFAGTEGFIRSVLTSKSKATRIYKDLAFEQYYLKNFHPNNVFLNNKMFWQGLVP